MIFDLFRYVHQHLVKKSVGQAFELLIETLSGINAGRANSLSKKGILHVLVV